MSGTLLLNGLRAVAVRFLVPWVGTWVAEVDVDLDVPTTPTGPAVLVIGTATPMKGTIDANASGRHGEKATVRVVGGGAGWQKTVTPKHFEAATGLLSSLVISTTAVEVGETVLEATPMSLGRSYVRTAGPASRVLSGRDWHVDELGVTVVGPRVTLPASPDVEILDWSPHEQCATFACDSLVQPGTILTDTKFGTATVRDVEQTFDASGSRGKAWCATSAPKAAGNSVARALRALAKDAVSDVYLRPHRYRVVSTEADKRLVLQAIDRDVGVPDLIPCAFWPSAAGVTADLPPGAVVLVQFAGPNIPIVTHVEAGTTPVKVNVAAGTSPVALYPDIATAWAALVAACAANVPTIVVPPLPATAASLKLFSE